MPAATREASSGHRRGLVVLGIAGLGLIGLSLTLWWLSPRPLSHAGGLPLAAVASEDAPLAPRDALPSGWRRIETLAAGSSAADAASLRDALGLDLPPAHFVVLPDGRVQVTSRWHRQLPPHAGYGRPDSISVALVGNATSLADRQRDAAAVLVQRLVEEFGLPPQQ